MNIRVLIVALLALACHAQIFRLNAGLPQNCGPQASPQLAYVHQAIAPTFVPSPQPAPQPQTRVCDCGHNQVPIVPPIIPQACGPIVTIPAPAPAPIPSPVPSPVRPSNCRKEEDSSSEDSSSEEESSEERRHDERKGRKCDRCDKEEKHCKCGSCSCKDKKNSLHKKDDKVKDLVKGGKSCDKCKGGKCECADCKCDSCKGKPLLNVIKPVLGLIHH